ncbi:MAG: peptide deformylase [Methylovulum sp.]|uniref:peptide deformylase n=1 Tax=Methylovulum sp. TaxID=1916980 RepID=UPI00262297EF|nr:peptide deformylase [Methylovulum sp.]MDD2725618.1 peptide deformylase [Methylovulum sp.]
MTAIYEIAQLGADILRQIAEPITDVHSPETRDMIIALQTTLATSQGVGLAAPQIGLSKRLIIVASRPTTRYPDAPLMEPTVMINPSYEILSGEQEKDWEGCLSIPSIRALVPRYLRILIRYTNQHGGPVESEQEGFIARIFQHEIDHLDGKVYLDRVVDTRDIVAESEYFKRLRD